MLTLHHCGMARQRQGEVCSGIPKRSLPCLHHLHTGWICEVSSLHYVNIRVLKAKPCTLSSLHFQMEKNLLLTLGFGWNLISKSLDSALSFSLVRLVVSEKKVWSPGILTHSSNCDYLMTLLFFFLISWGLLFYSFYWSSII